MIWAQFVLHEIMVFDHFKELHGILEIFTFFQKCFKFYEGSTWRG